MKFKKRLISFLLVCAMLIPSNVVQVFASEEGLDVQQYADEELVVDNEKNGRDEGNTGEGYSDGGNSDEENSAEENVKQESATGEHTEEPVDQTTTEEPSSDEQIEESVDENKDVTEEQADEEEQNLQEDNEEEIIVEYKEIESISTDYKLALESLKELFPEYIIAYTNKNNEIKIKIYNWTAIDDYDQYIGSYKFEPVIETDYVIEEDLKNPILTVNVKNESDGRTGLVEINDGYEVPSVSSSKSSNLLRSSATSSSYNGYEAGYLPEIRNQGREGACWAFSTLGAVETDLIKSGEANSSIDLSELQLAYFTAHDYTDPTGSRDDSYTYSGDNYLSNGGNSNISSQALMNKVGAVSEAYVPYSKGASYVPGEEYALCQDYAEVTDVYQININDKELIKQAILDHGSVSAAFYASEGSYTMSYSDGTSAVGQVRYSATYNSFYGEIDSTNHAITLVGWDDNFSADNFYDGCKPEGNGAWLVRNSWGLDDYGKSGYFWLSYYDKGLLSSKSVTAYSATRNMYDNVYSYSSSEYTGYLESHTAGGSLTAQVEYTIPSGQSIDAVAVQILNTNATVNVTVDDGTNTSTGSYTNTCAGIYTIVLDNPIQTTSNTNITLKYTIQASSSECPRIAYDINGSALGGLTHTVSCEKGFDIVNEGDITHYKSNDAKVKLFTNNSSASTVNGKLELTNSPIYDHAGKSYQLELTQDSIVNNPEKITWSVINEDVATVDAKGTVTVGNKKGTTVVKGTYSDGANTYSVAINVTVKPYSIDYVLGDDVSYRKLYKSYYPGNEDYCILPTASDISKSGYALWGWTTVEGDSEKAVNSNSLINLQEDLVLYPIWTKYAIGIYYYQPEAITAESTTYSTQKRNIANITISDAPYTLPGAVGCNYNPNDYSSDGLVFDYWSTDSEGKNPISIISEDEFIPIKNTVYGTYSYKKAITLYPQYKATDTYKVTLDANGGTITKDTITVSYGGTYSSLVTPTRTGYTFVNWHLDTIDGEVVTKTTLVSTEANHKLIAEWMPKAITITFNPLNGSLDTTTKNVVYGEPYGTMPIPVRKGYEFGGWYYGSNSNIISEDTTVEMTANHTLKALWTPLKIKVLFDANGGTCSTTSKTVTYGTRYSYLPKPVRSGYTFKAWHIDSLDGEAVTSSITVTMVDNHSLIAEWDANSYTIAFNANEGSVDIDNKNVKYDDMYGTLPIPTREGYTFDAWHNGSATGEEITENSTVTTASNHTLYASWIQNTYEISFDANGGDVDLEHYTVTYDDAYGELPTPERTNYIFEGWHINSIDGDRVDFSTIVTTADNHTLVANWIQDGFTITFNATEGNFGAGENGNSITDNYIVLKKGDTYGKYGDFPVPTCEGKYLVGWYTDKDVWKNQIKVDTEFVLGEDQVLYALWDDVQTVANPEIEISYTYGDSPENVGLGSTISVSTETIGAKTYYSTSEDFSDKKECTSENIVLDKTGTITYYFVASKEKWQDSEVVAKTFTVVEEKSGVLEKDAEEYNQQGRPDGIWIAGLEDSYVYKGAAYKFVPDDDFRVYDGIQLLTYKTDYTYVLKNNTNVGNMTITITGRGNYSGSYVKTVKITPKSLDSCEKILKNGAYYLQKNALIKPDVLVNDYRNGANVTLTKNRDYTVEYCEYSTPETITSEEVNTISTTVIDITKIPGEKQVVIRGKGNYTGKAILTYTTQGKDEFISPIKLNAKKLVIEGFEDKMVWSSEGNQQNYTSLIYDGEELTENVDYVIVRANRATVGTAKDVIYGIGKYTGSVAKSYKIVTAATLSVSNTTVIIGNSLHQFKNAPYTSEDLEVQLLLGENELEQGTDYEVVMPKDSTNAGKKSIIIKGIGAYGGRFTAKEKFEITKVDTSQLTIEYSQEPYTYNKGGIKLFPEIKFADSSINPTPFTEAQIKSYFRIKWQGNTNSVTEIKFTAIPKANFVGGEISDSYSIEGKDISTINAVTCADRVYNGRANNYKSSPILTDSNGKRLAAGTDYFRLTDDDYRYKEATSVMVKVGKNLVEEKRLANAKVEKTDIIPVGTVIKVTVTGKGNYTGTKEIDFKVIAGDISKARITLKSTGTLKLGTDYTGKAQLINKEDNFDLVKIGNIELTTSDYRILEYKNNMKKGRATITLQGIGNYGGTKTFTFNIKAKSMCYKLAYVAPEQIINDESIKITGTMATKLTNNGVYTLPQPTFRVDTKKYVFEGWYYDAEFTQRVGEKGTVIDCTGIIKPSQTVTIYAKYEPVGTYTVHFNMNAPEDAVKTSGNTNRTNSQVFKRGAFSRLAGNGYNVTGYKFVGWSTEPAPSEENLGETFTNKQFIYNLRTSGDTVELYAQWVKK